MKSLSIAIPTYNKPDVLLDILSTKNRFFLEHHICVYIYDDSENLKTRDAILDFIKLGNKNIYYTHNKGLRGYDHNARRSLFETPGDYVYFVGDGLLVKESAFEKILQAIEKNYDLILMNNLIDKDCEYNDSAEFYLENGWIATLAGASVYKRSTIERAKSRDMSKYMNLLFFHYGVIFEGLDFNASNIYVVSGKNIKGHKKKGLSFAAKSPFKIFCYYWVKVNENLPDRYGKYKEEVIKSHDKKTKLFSDTIVLILLRKDGCINKKEYKKYKKYIDRSLYKKKKIRVILCIPQVLLSVSYKKYKKIS